MTADRGLIRFFFTFEQPPLPPYDGLISLDSSPNGPGEVGVTACDRDDALSLVRERFWPDGGMPAVASVLEDVDVSNLRIDGRRLGVPVWRGVWYPAFPF